MGESIFEETSDDDIGYLLDQLDRGDAVPSTLTGELSTADLPF